jgi:hypothetical protein
MVQKRESPVSAGAGRNVKRRKKYKRKPANGGRAKTPKFPDAEKLLANPRFADACFVVAMLAAPRKSREEIWLQRTGKSWKALTEFPGRLQRMADEIESLNTKFFGIPEACENPTLASFYQLPTILRSYAQTLSRRTTRIPKAFPALTRSRWLSRISNLTKWATGKCSDKETTELLNDAAAAMGYEDMPGFDALQLEQVRYRQKKRRKT